MRERMPNIPSGPPVRRDRLAPARSQLTRQHARECVPLWRAHSCVPCRQSCRHRLIARKCVPSNEPRPLGSVFRPAEPRPLGSGHSESPYRTVTMRERMPNIPSEPPVRRDRLAPARSQLTRQHARGVRSVVAHALVRAVSTVMSTPFDRQELRPVQRGCDRRKRLWVGLSVVSCSRRTKRSRSSSAFRTSSHFPSTPFCRKLLLKWTSWESKG